ncbi:LysE family translocator [Mucilaginibacter phyllosphaerae]|uniref:LysE family translocator n=1 Tax=Mucilaginibacter phyllosphaerae TaxID=1812349 RepID=A0A4Y8AJX3_9SPHI|nr:LysE family translocator [Mucilaginibacter phyllosphaerae]MBB3967629.1 threonine/homoserine/homoserine lactone efflux protein [Mucilaginibacter phyllosphaerae]TEW69314.1 LysE family translocator [Mucilaginibacter phyllosphaerae]GGH21818.1 lysine transporter LysE [Mucilaginibacter phyllosphaerae]
MGIINFTTFCITSLLFILSPGIDTIFILNKLIAQGKKWGLYSTLGITTGVLVHTTFAAFGLSLILAQSATAFSIVKYLGAAYLIYLGFSKLFTSENMVTAESRPQPVSVKKTYLSAVITNTLNPKVAIFFLAFFPQFIQPVYMHNALPFIILGATYALIGLLWFTILTLFAGSFSHKLQSTPAIGMWLNKFSGAVFILMGVKVALTKR